jgi:hypothetical protein
MAVPASLAIASNINLIINPIGMAFASLVLLSIIGLGLVNKNLTSRMTVRLVAVIAFTDLLAHVGEYYAASNLSLVVGTPVCTGVNGFRLFARTFYCCINLAICFHLYRSLVLLKKSTLKSEIFIWITTSVAVITITLYYWGIGAMEGVKGRGRCTPGVSDKTLNAAFTAVQGSVNLFTIVIGILTIVSCRRNLNKWINVFSSTLTEHEDNLDQLIQERRKIAIRSFLYPLSTCITLPFEAIFLFLTATEAYPFNMSIPMNLTTDLAGILTAAAFSIDPSTHQSFKSAYHQIKYENRDKKDSLDNFGVNNNDIAL